ncbi:hypothetical protein HB364_06950 [Pseudoflavitalea sp. X16]|uniref:DUF6932 family protein n=1 Tax=Paraflavitalea devenefica TaxID=2716334 RepID=UPI00141F7753|nr:hypothetical protein [Paraflavitalea devenefica]NII24808.1 hypothetical protein [Paraflavitalea devenefica]
MKISFNTNGNLHKTIELTFDELYEHFGTNPSRKKQIDTAILFLKLFSSCGCTTAYIGGSFASTKEQPADIDLCVDLCNADYEQLEQEFPDFFDFNKIGEIHKRLKCHILHIDKVSTRLLEMLQIDRDEYPKGLIKLNLKDIDSYDQ